jgi:transcriptional regulator with XRE-family HTH domain
MRFAKTLQQVREHRGMSQSQLAEKSGLPLRSIQNWEQKHREPRAQALLALARALGVSVEMLIVGNMPKGKAKA